VRKKQNNTDGEGKGDIWHWNNGEVGTVREKKNGNSFEGSWGTRGIEGKTI